MKTNLLNQLLTKTNNCKNMELFLKALFTNKELKELDNRLKIFQMLLHGKKQREISEDLNVGIATVTRGSYAFENEEIFKIKSNIIDILRANHKKWLKNTMNQIKLKLKANLNT